MEQLEAMTAELPSLMRSKTHQTEVDGLYDEVGEECLTGNDLDLDDELLI